MTEVAIRVEHLSKRTRIGVAEERPDTLVGAALSWLKSPLDNYRRLRRLTTFEENHTPSGNHKPPSAVRRPPSGERSEPPCWRWAPMVLVRVRIAR